MLFCPLSHILSSQWKPIHTVSFIPKGWWGGGDTKSMSYFHVGLLIWQVWGKQIYNLYISLSTEISILTWRKWNGTASHLSRNSQAAFSTWLSLVKVHITCYKTDQSFYVPSQLSFSLMTWIPVHESPLLSPACRQSCMRDALAGGLMSGWRYKPRRLSQGYETTSTLINASG